ncbi:MAG: hypothetical protein NTW67_06615 [Candidatus Woesearchaeota archaeon]|nr:hypothetical protein [Candidatus Woesearchaeota archaeon]
MNKKGFELKDIILALVSLAVLLFVGSYFYEALGQTGEKTTCSWSVLLSKIGSFTATDLPPECKANDLYITKEGLATYDEIAKIRVKKYHATPGYESISAIYPEADLGYQRSKIEFDPDLPAALKRQTLQLAPWMRSEMYYGKTYFDYLMNDQEPTAWEKAPSYDLNKRWAVVYWYVEPDYAGQAAVGLLKFTGTTPLAEGATKLLNLLGANVDIKQPLTQVYLSPYDDITRPMEQGGLGCEKLIG